MNDDEFALLKQAPLCDQLQIWADDLSGVGSDPKMSEKVRLTRKEFADLGLLLQQAADALRRRGA